MDVSELRGLVLFDGLDDAQLGALLDAAQEHRFVPGEVLFREGLLADTWWVLLEGTVALVRRVGTEDTTMGMMATPGQWAGGFAAWDEFGTYLATGRAESRGRLLRLSAADLRRLSEQWFPFGLHFIDGLVNTVRRIEATARQREALVALGTLSAGLAHELNNPAAAATRAVDALRQTSDQRLETLARLAAGGITATQFGDVDRLRRRISDTDSGLTGLDLADREERARRLARGARRRRRVVARTGPRRGRRRRRVVRGAGRGRLRGVAGPGGRVGRRLGLDERAAR